MCDDSAGGALRRLFVGVAMVFDAEEEGGEGCDSGCTVVGCVDC